MEVKILSQKNPAFRVPLEVYDKQDILSEFKDDTERKFFTRVINQYEDEVYNHIKNGKKVQLFNLGSVEFRDATAPIKEKRKELKKLGVIIKGDAYKELVRTILYNDAIKRDKIAADDKTYRLFRNKHIAEYDRIKNSISVESANIRILSHWLLKVIDFDQEFEDHLVRLKNGDIDDD